MVICTGALVKVALFQLLGTSLKFLKSCCVSTSQNSTIDKSSSGNLLTYNIESVPYSCKDKKIQLRLLISNCIGENNE